MFRRLCTLATATVALAGLAAGPAGAAGWPDPQQPPPPPRLVVSGQYTGALVNGLQIAAACEAVAADAAAAVVIDQCYLTSNTTNHQIAVPLNSAAIAFQEQVFTLDFTLCFHAHVVEVATPDRTVAAGGCTDSTLPGGLGGSGTATA